MNDQFLTTFLFLRLITKKIFNNDHDLKVSLALMDTNGTTIAKFQCDIFSNAGFLSGQGDTLLEAYLDAIKTVQR